MYHNHWKRLLCLALVLTLLMSISAVLAAPYDAKNTENTYDQTGNQFTPSIDTDLSYDSYTTPRIRKIRMTRRETNLLRPSIRICRMIPTRVSETASLPDSATMITIPMTDPSWRISMRKTTAGLIWIL